MTVTLDGVAASRRLEVAYLRYLRGLLPVNNDRLAGAVAAALESEQVVRGPYLEMTPPYEAGSTLRTLIDEGVLHPLLERLDHPGGIPLDRPLHHHQEHAVRRAVSGRNLVVATGTGSGKTESFLLPILDHLAREASSGTLGAPGVRALLLYPMNALANDQLKRLRALLVGWPEITFGRYTGETQHEARRAREDFAVRFPGVEPPQNELLSREEMQARPPHLLLTNYAMLEYLLLRPADTTLFDGDTGRFWRYLVLDEAHVYDGSAGSEVALLLRRLADRVGGQGLRAIATSATVGGERSGPAVAAFARQLFDLPFDYEEGEPSRQDIVWAVRRDLTRTPPPSWDGLDVRALTELQQLDTAAQLNELRRLSGRSDGAAEILQSESHIQALLRLLVDGPRPVIDVAAVLFPEMDPDAATAATAALVTLGAAAVDSGGTPVVPARYHLWARATEGAFVCLGPDGPHVRLTRHESCDVCDAAMVELGACKRCNATYLVATRTRSGDDVRLTPPSEAVGQTAWFLLDESLAAATPDDATTVGAADEDDAVLEDLDEGVAGALVAFCPRCGRLGTGTTTGCNCAVDPIRLLELDAHGRVLPSCVRCGGRSRAGQIRRLQSGADASVSVLATTLYQALPPDPDPGRGSLPGGGRKLLLFADSRQDAAYFAPYLERSYGDLLRRSTLLSAIRGLHDPSDPPTLALVARRVATVADEAGYFPHHLSGRERRLTAATWVHAELLSVGIDLTLEGLGLISFEVSQPPGLKLPQPLLDLGLDAQEAWSLIGELLRTLRTQGAVSTPEDVDPKDELFEPRTGPIWVRGIGSEPKRKVLSWLPTRGQNTRRDYLKRVLGALESPLAEGDGPTQVLDGLWRWLVALPDATRLLVGHNDPALGVLHRLDQRLLTVRLVTPERPVVRCNRCQRPAPVSLRGVCTTLGCSGMSVPWYPPAHDDNHYREVAQSLQPFPMRVSEHTAQFRSTEAARRQQEFLDGTINALSCSTTFELGVDVGELETVVLRNVPPTTSNYIQRAGRAGRRTSSAALVLTYAQRRSHDLTHFRDPVGMIAGHVRAPRITVENERIARRHVHAIALAAYFRLRADSDDIDLRLVGDLFDGQEELSLIGWLESADQAVTEAALRVMPESLHHRLGLHDGSWTIVMRDLINAIGATHHQDVDLFRQKEQEAVQEKAYRKAAYFERVVVTFERRQLLGHLSATNVLPKYGFPVDTVELRTAHVGTEEAAQIELSRDLRVAIAEYAPGSQVVAAGKLWESAGIYRLRDRDLPRYHFASCSCGWYRQSIEEFGLESCPACGATGRRAPLVRQFIQPEFGFVASPKPPGVPKGRPERVFAGSAHLVDGSLEGDPQVVVLTPSTKLEMRYAARGRLAVINAGPSQRGYRVCTWCGFGEGVANSSMKKKAHRRPLTDDTCNGPTEWLSLGHQFETDVLELKFLGVSVPRGAEVWWGLLYAIVEAAAEELQITRDDLDGTLHLDVHGSPTLILFDDVPAGAGHVRQLSDHIIEVLQSALVRVTACECGNETSCYRCLRSFRNQRMHDSLRRGAVAELLTSLLEADRSARVHWRSLEDADLNKLVGRTVRLQGESDAILEGRLWRVPSDTGASDDSEIAGFVIEQGDTLTPIGDQAWRAIAVRDAPALRTAGSRPD